jgi:hypothetical protein
VPSGSGSDDAAAEVSSPYRRQELCLRRVVESSQPRAGRGTICTATCPKVERLLTSAAVASVVSTRGRPLAFFPPASLLAPVLDRFLGGGWPCPSLSDEVIVRSRLREVWLEQGICDWVFANAWLRRRRQSVLSPKSGLGSRPEVLYNGGERRA